MVSDMYLTLYQTDKISDMTKLKVFADNKLNIARMMKFLLDTVENTVGKKEEMLVTSISPFPTVFSKAFFFWVVKSWDYVVKS